MSAAVLGGPHAAAGGVVSGQGGVRDLQGGQVAAVRLLLLRAAASLRQAHLHESLAVHRRGQGSLFPLFSWLPLTLLLSQAGTEAQEVFTIGQVDMDKIRAVLVSGCGLGLADGLDTDRTVTGCSSFITGTLGPNGGRVTCSSAILIFK